MTSAVSPHRPSNLDSSSEHFSANAPVRLEHVMSIGAVCPPKGAFPGHCHASLTPSHVKSVFSPNSVMTSWPAQASMAGGHNRGGLGGCVGHACLSQNATRDGYPRPGLTDLPQTSLRRRLIIIEAPSAHQSTGAAAGLCLQSRKATSRRAASAARRSVSDFAKRMSSEDARRWLAEPACP